MDLLSDKQNCGLRMRWECRERARLSPWTSYQISKIAGCACAGNAGNVFPNTDFKETASQRSRHASRHVRHAHTVMHVGIANPWWRGKGSQHYRRMRNPHFCVSDKRSMLCASCHSEPGSLFNITMSSYQYRKSHCGDKTVVRSSYFLPWLQNLGKRKYVISHHIKWSVLYMSKKIWHFKILL